MADNAVSGLHAARERLLRERKVLALRLGNDKFKVDDIAPALIKLQQALEIVELAISAEDGSERSVYEHGDIREA
ncbi:hypothetical protein ACRBEV_10175 [Methylobacterium phyllosphaerae]